MQMLQAQVVCFDASQGQPVQFARIFAQVVDQKHCDMGDAGIVLVEGLEAELSTRHYWQKCYRTLAIEASSLSRL
jgi:hypothetical protein